MLNLLNTRLGRALRRRLRSVSRASTYQDEIRSIQEELDADFYKEQYGSEIGDTDVVAHYCKWGWRELRDPSPNFSTAHYLETNPDVKAAGVNPFWHFLTSGRKEGRAPTPEQDMGECASPRAAIQGATNDALIGLLPYFDSVLYLSRYPDVAETKIDPLLHYCKYGWLEGRDPTANFSTSYYLEVNPDVKKAGVNPFWHFVVAGKEEGRLAQHPGGYMAKQLLEAVPLETAVQAWARSDAPEKTLAAVEIVAGIQQRIGETTTCLVLSASHDHYQRIIGGVQLCLQREERLAPGYGAVYLNFHPWQPMPRLSHLDEDPDPYMTLVLDGHDLGSCRTSELIAAVAQLSDAFEDMRLVIHQMLGHSPELLVQLLAVTGRQDCWMWLHDFFSICPSFTLQRNGLKYCGAPEVTSNACTLCRFGPERGAHAQRMRAFFEESQVHLLAPSEAAKTPWEARAGLNAASIQIVPHIQLEWTPRENEAPAPRSKIVIGFLGTPAPHKGWYEFQRLANQCDPEKYQFIQFNSNQSPASRVDFTPVRVTASDPDAMIQKVSEAQVDFVLHWANWPETFSLTTYEALAGGAYVLTNTISGNVAATVQRLGRGVVLDDSAAISTFFSDGGCDEMVQTLRAERRDYEVKRRFSDVSFEVLSATIEAAQ